MISVSNLAFAQNEVRGVETKLAKYNGPRYYSDEGTCDPHRVSNLWFGFQFTNLNSIPVSVDVELYRDDELISTKSFVLKSKETYIWKFEHIHSFRACYLGDECETLEGGYYVRYKAYKLE